MTEELTHEERENLVEDLNNSIDDVLDESGVTELIEEFQRLADLQEEYDSRKNNAVNRVREFIHDSFPEDEVIGGKIRVRDGDVYKNNSPSKASPSEILDAVRKEERFTDEDVDRISEVLGVRGNRLKKEIENKTRVLMDDDRDFDAVTLRVKGSRRYLKLVRLDGGKSHKMQPLEDIVNKHVEELIKFVRYQDEKMQVTQEMVDRVSDAIEDIDEVFENLEEIEAGDNQ
ncbi:Inhibitor of growth protein N-terminal histone-binding [Haloarcula vallismortis]|uniref:Inhibitor of growth protein N-terminal histone-binding domain-containing protein n=2 Tax=Haloarcula vallismortis TaxID=28442 RepID=M0JLA8_HALVA|nr:hypothetical protein [Haloarcula vallismortis]EMA09927.1 hypothetical protein C437_04700 [Haloarcula vallismortis ATCC 29715]SDX28372.1 Inhibitor of growth protein N-terminal histone-binding [Haloarcula vallismortis]